MQLYYSHIAASSSPMYGGGLRWGTNDLALKRTEVGVKRPRTKRQPAQSKPKLHLFGCLTHHLFMRNVLQNLLETAQTFVDRHQLHQR